MLDESNFRFAVDDADGLPIPQGREEQEELRDKQVALTKDRELVRLAVARYPRNYRYVHCSLHDDLEIVLICLGLVFQGAAVDPGTVELADLVTPGYKFERPDMIEALGPHSRLRRELVLFRVAAESGYNTARHPRWSLIPPVDAVVTADAGLMGTAVQEVGRMLRYASENLRDDPHFVTLAVQQNGLALEFASDRLRATKEIVVAAVSQNWRAREHAVEELQIHDDVKAAARESSVRERVSGGAGALEAN